MEKHIKIIGILYIVCSALRILIVALGVVFVIGAGIISGDADAITITSIAGPIIFFFVLMLSIPGIIGGIGLLNYRPWARILVLILGFLKLLSMPFGTALGIYTIVILMRDDTIKLFKKKRK